jgi:hypothetical protein
VRLGRSREFQDERLRIGGVRERCTLDSKRERLVLEGRAWGRLKQSLEEEQRLSRRSAIKLELGQHRIRVSIV